MDVVQERLQGAVEALKRDLSGLRAGRADASMLDHLEVSAYGSMQPLSAVAQVSVKGPALLMVNAFDPSVRVSPPRGPGPRPAAPCRRPHARNRPDTDAQRHCDRGPGLGDGPWHQGGGQRGEGGGPEADQGDTGRHGQNDRQTQREGGRHTHAAPARRERAVTSAQPPADAPGEATRPARAERLREEGQVDQGQRQRR